MRALTSPHAGCRLSAPLGCLDGRIWLDSMRNRSRNGEREERLRPLHQLTQVRDVTAQLEQAVPGTAHAMVAATVHAYMYSSWMRNIP
jgi:hypothetical protein